MSIRDNIIQATKDHVKINLKDAEGGHDWFHTLRVYNNAKLISKNEKVDKFVVALAALLHDIADSKFHNGDDTIGPKRAREFLFKHNVDSLVINNVVDIINNISFNKSLENIKDKYFLRIRCCSRCRQVGCNRSYRHCTLL